jgi:hypothetical protein
MKPPFTCGGMTRQAIIKYFVREHINKNEQGVSLVVQLIRKQIEKLKTAWSVPATDYACTNPETGLPDFESCDSANPDSFAPSGLDVQFAEIAGRDILKVRASSVYCCL